MLYGVDCSTWQGAIDFNKLKTAKDFIIIKATEGVGYTDPKFAINQQEARKAGMLIGYYCYTRPDLGNSVKSEVDYLLSVIAGLEEGELIFLDYEVTYSQPVEWCKLWLDYLASRLGGMKGLVYLNQSLLKGHDWTPVVKESYGLWLAVYDYDANLPVPASQWSVTAFKQYSNREKVAGIPTPVDANVFYGDKKAFIKYGYKESVTAPQDVEVLKKRIADLETELSNMTKRYEDSQAIIKAMQKTALIRDSKLRDIAKELEQVIQS